MTRSLSTLRIKDPCYILSNVEISSYLFIYLFASRCSCILSIDLGKASGERKGSNFTKETPFGGTPLRSSDSLGI